MSENDRILAARLLDKKKLSEGQAQQLLEEAGRTGRSLKEIALGRGLVSAQDCVAEPAKQVPTAVVLLLFAGLMLLMGIALLVTRHFQERSQPTPVQRSSR
jgi:hypothetical protein